ncbi:VOC family protein [Spirulina sp. CS-785/01]|uniref:VOC family protein n=1 Tax=Spirulina sp. CS-785/01 TaxID=3021716 RepID=UPI00232DE1BF|nr:VOC family protein [Spirulina sp. CS-785/01]MDB9313172.1 VOC family protein [Spirulina sp. CS-785/01]
MEITQGLHTAILVSDLNQAKSFYEGILELNQAERNLNFPGEWYQVGDYQIHLMVNEAVEPKTYNEEKWGRNAHLALQIQDLAPLKRRLTEHNIPFQMSSSGRAALFVKDPDGNIIEVNEQ